MSHQKRKAETGESVEKKAKQLRMNKNIINYVVGSMKPLRTVEDENFLKIIHGKLFFIWILLNVKKIDKICFFR